MKDSLHNYMKVGLVHFMAHPACMGGEGPVVESISELCTDTFWDFLEIAPIKDPQAAQQVKALAEQSRVELAVAAQPVLLGGQLDLNSADSAARTAAIEAVKASIDFAETIGSAGVALLSGPVCEDYEAGKDRLVDSLEQICTYATEKGIRITLETFDQVPYGKNCLIGPTADAVEIATRVRQSHPDFGLLLDLSHLPLIGEPSRESLTLAQDFLTHIHIGNCAMDDPSHPAYGDNHPRFGAPGTRNDVPELVEFLRVLLDIGYLEEGSRRPVSFEVKPMAGEDCAAVIAGSQRTLIEAWKQLRK